MHIVRFGIVGLGSMGLGHAKTLLGGVPEATLTAVATTNPARIQRLRALEGGERVRVFDTPAQMYKSGEIDAVLIASPHRAHVAQAVEALGAGVPVLLEKPAGVFTREVQGLVRAADSCGLPFGMMFNQRTHPAYRKMKEIVDSGELGQIIRTSVVVTDWLRAQSYYDSGAWRATWRDDGGGVLLNQAPHNLDLWQWICGMPVRVHAFCGLGRWHDIEVEDDVTAYVEYGNGATGTFVTCTGETPGANRFEISLDGGKLLFERGRLTLSRPDTPASRFIREYANGYGAPTVTTRDITPEAENPMHAGVLRAFARHMLFGEPMIADGREGLRSLMLSNGMLLSSWTDRTIALPMGEADEAEFESMLAARAERSPKKTAKAIEMDLSKSF